MFGPDAPKPKGPPPNVPEFDRSIQGGIIQTRVFSGAASIASKQGAIFHRNVYGHTSFELPQKKVDYNTIWDLGALTKPLGTGLALMWLLARNRLALDAPISRLLHDFQLPQWNEIRVEHLLDHTSGLPHRLPIYETIKAEHEKTGVKLVGSPQGLAKAREMVWKYAPKKGPGQVSMYSEVGWMILGWVVEAVTNKRLDMFLMQDVYKPLGLPSFFFVDLNDPKQPHAKKQFIATENCKWRKRVITGQVHDSDAYTMGGIAGHAGLFGTLDDVHKLTQLLADSYAGKPGAPILSGAVKRFFKRSNRECNTTWALSWDTPPPKDGMCGARMSRNAVGHLALIGHAIWIDLQNEVITVTLSNRIHPTGEGKDAFMAKWRPHLEDLYAGYAKQWSPPPPEEEEIDEYAIVREREAKKKKLQQAGKAPPQPKGAAPSAGIKKGPAAPPK